MTHIIELEQKYDLVINVSHPNKIIKVNISGIGK